MWAVGYQRVPVQAASGHQGAHHPRTDLFRYPAEYVVIMPSSSLDPDQFDCVGGPLDGAVASVGCSDDAGVFSFFVDDGCSQMRVHSYRLCRRDCGNVYFGYFGVELMEPV